MPANTYEFLAQRQSQAVKLLDRNPSVSNFIQATIEHLIDYAQHRGLAFEDIVLDRPFVEGYTGDEYLRARIRHR